MKKLEIIFVLMIFALFVKCSEDTTIGGIEFGEIKGRVVEAISFEPIENAKITLSPTNNTTFTDVNGNFIFEEAPTNQYSVEASKEEYLNSFEPVSLEAGASINVVFEMEISTALNKPPTKPELITPDDGAIGLPNEVELSWLATDQDEDELTYTIEIRNDFNSDITIITDIKELTYTIVALKYGAKYFWSVEVTDGINDAVISNISAFTIIDDPTNRHTYVKNEGGNNVIYSSSFNDANDEVSNTVQLTSSSLNSWRPRKNNLTNLIAFLRIYDNETHIYTMKPNGDDVKKVTAALPLAGFNLNELDFTWSPDGSKLLYPYFNKLYSINIDGSGLQEVYETVDGSLISECDWSIDGLKIVVKTNNENGYNGSILVIDLNGTVLNTVISGIQGALGGLNLSASGNLLLFTRDVSNHQVTGYRQLDTRIFIYDFTDSTFKDVSEGEKEIGFNDLDPRFSPNEAEVIFVNTSNDGLSQNNITKTDLEGNTDRVVLFTNASMPDYE